MKNKIPRLYIFLTAFFYIASIAFLPSVTALSIVDTETLDATGLLYNDLVYHSNNYYLLAYTEADYDLNIKCLNIDGSGFISTISEWIIESDASYFYPQIEKIGNGFFILCYKNSSNYLIAKSFYVTAEGGIIQSAIDTETINTSISIIYNLIKINNSEYLYMVSYSTSINTMIQETFNVSADGTDITQIANRRIRSFPGITLTNEIDSNSFLINWTTDYAYIVTTTVYGYKAGLYYTYNISCLTNKIKISDGSITAITSNYTYNEGNNPQYTNIYPTSISSSIGRRYENKTYFIVSIIVHGYQAGNRGRKGVSYSFEINTDGEADSLKTRLQYFYTYNTIYYALAQSTSCIQTDTTKASTLFYDGGTDRTLNLVTYSFDTGGSLSLLTDDIILPANVEANHVNIYRIKTNGIYGILYYLNPSLGGYMKSITGLPSFGDLDGETAEEGPTYAENTINFVFLDSFSGARFADGVFGKGQAATRFDRKPSIGGDVTSDLWEGTYTTTGVFPETLFILFSEGSFHTFNFKNLTGYISDLYYEFENLSVTLKLYSGQTFYIVFQRKGGTPGWENCALSGGTTRLASVCTDKTIYLPGEYVSVRYALATIQTLRGMNWWGGWPTSNYYLCFVKDLDWWKIYPSVGDADYPFFAYVDGSSGYPDQHEYPDLGLYHELSFLPDAPDDNFDEYKIYVVYDGGWPFPDPYLLTIAQGLKIQVIDNEEGFLPEGEIEYISPDDPVAGQNVEIGFTANNNGVLKVHYLFDQPEEYVHWQDFKKPTGVKTTSFQPIRPGLYTVELFIDYGSNLSESPIDTEVFRVNQTGDDFGLFGFNAEHLYVPNRRVIAGYSQTNIIYNCLKPGGGLLTITDPTGARTPYSMNVNGTGNFTIYIPSYAEIGSWNVTLIGNETLYESFNVIATEGNWIEFSKNIFYEGEDFSCIIRHKAKISLTFYKNGIAQGSNIILEADEMTSGLLVIPKTSVMTTQGNWHVEMWSVNDLVRIKKLARWDCQVALLPDGRTAVQTFSPSLYVPYPYDIIIGVVIILGLTIAPTGLILSYNKTQNTQIEIKNEILLYISLITGFTGYMLTILWGLLPWWSLFALIFILVVIFAIKWYTRKPEGG